MKNVLLPKFVDGEAGVKRLHSWSGVGLKAAASSNVCALSHLPHSIANEDGLSEN